MADLPEAEGRQRGQERDSADPFIERLVRGIGAMTGIVTDDEQTSDPQGRHQGSENFDPPRLHDQQAGKGHAQHQPVEQEPDDRRGDAGLHRKGLQQLLKSKTRFVDGQRRRCVRLGIGC